MAAQEAQRPETPEVLNLPPAATPSSPLDDHRDRRVHPVIDSNFGFYAPSQHRNHDQSQASLQQPLIQSRNPFGDNAESASIAPSVATSNPPNYASAVRYGHRSEEEYLAALRAWAEEKQYVQLDKNGGLIGFYGQEELQERAQRMTKERRAEKEMKLRMKAERRGTMAAPENGGQTAGGRRRGSLANFFRRQSNAV